MQGIPRWARLILWYENDIFNFELIRPIFVFSLQIIFLETICNDRNIIERNIRLKIQQSPDYAEE